jgi:2'-hydroxyisoflavone reductase
LDSPDLDEGFSAMKMLMLGGTRFVGRHVVEEALLRGHEVTLFTRGRSENPFGDRCRHIEGNRDGATGAGLSGLDLGTWDAVVDTSGYFPKQVAATAELLKDRCDRYVFISSVSAYADLSRPMVDENAALALLEDPLSEDVHKDYSGLKAACEAEVSRIYGARSLIARPGLVIGPYDPTDRFPYWAARFGSPTLLGRGDEMVAMPAPPSQPIQCIDARDIAQWLLLSLLGGNGGVFNLVSPANALTMGSLAEAGHRLSVSRGFDLPVRWVEEKDLLTHGVTPWTGLPLWIPSTQIDMAGLQQVDGTRAQAAGLVCRPLHESLTATLEWMVTTPGALDGRFTGVMDGVTEAQLTGVAVR